MQLGLAFKLNLKLSRYVVVIWDWGVKWWLVLSEMLGTKLHFAQSKWWFSDAPFKHFQGLLVYFRIESWRTAEGMTILVRTYLCKLPCAQWSCLSCSSCSSTQYKTNISKFQFDQESGGRRTTMWMCYLQIAIYLFYYFYLFIYKTSKPLFSVLSSSKNGDFSKRKVLMKMFGRLHNHYTIYLINIFISED